MKKIIVCIILFFTLGFAEAPDFHAMQTITVNGKPLDMSPGVGFCAPQVVDWDSDGKKDLLIGEFAAGGGGKIRFYSNTGTDDKPEFGDFVWLKEEGQEIKVNSY